MMNHLRSVDITELAVLSEQFPVRLSQLGFHLMQVRDEAGNDLFRYVVPPICEVPAGPFLRGSDPQRDPEAEDNEPPQSVICLPTFSIGIYPVTVAEYSYAVKTGVVPGPATREGVTWHRQQQSPDHPVVCITWHQAKAYAMWLQQVTRQPWRLPTEAEWEKAARGIDGRIYHWGDIWDPTRANTNDGGPGTTTPVGSYTNQGDASLYGAHDMAGKVMEWTNSLYQDCEPYRKDQAKNDADRISGRALRGGTWGYEPCDARVTFHTNDLPDGSDSGVGMRLALGTTDEPRTP
jgi:formylglycine-generating enzyme required for sulfatase activity